MQSIKTNDKAVIKAAKAIKTGNRMQSTGKKLVDAGKASITQWLKAERNLELETLKIGDMVNLESLCLVEIGCQNRFDEASFQLANPSLYADYKKDFAVRKFKPLV